METKNREQNINKRNLLATGLVVAGILGLNYLGYRLGFNADFLAAHFALTLGVGMIFFYENFLKIKKNMKDIKSQNNSRTYSKKDFFLELQEKEV